MPTDGGTYSWDEKTKKWVAMPGMIGAATTAQI
jgi:hypothetical protein